MYLPRDTIEVPVALTCPAIQKGLDNLNAAWKTATEAMYAQGEQGQAQDAQPQGEAQGDNVQDVEYEEVK